MAEIERYGPGEGATRLDPGDFILTHRFRPIAGAIRIGQELRFRGPDSVYARWTHCALVVGADGSIVEAESVGVKLSPIAKYTSREYHLVRLGDQFQPEGRKHAVEYANAQVGQAFGFLALSGATLFLLFGLHLRLMRADHQICSSLVVRALQTGGLLQGADPALMLPADLAKIYNVKP